MKHRALGFGIVVALGLTFALSGHAQSGGGGQMGQMGMQQGGAAAADPLSAALKRMYDGIKRNLTEAAEKMPEADYAFKPAGTAPEVRNFGQLVTHVAASQMTMCGGLKGMSQDQLAAERKRFEELDKSGTKATIVKALADSFAPCDEVFAAMTDAKAMEMLPGQMPAPRAARLVQVIAHGNETYGTMVPYMRMKGLVPPSTERSQPMRRPM